MAARKVLGNDPFKRGAAPRAAVTGAPLPPSTKPAKRRPPTPELQQPANTTTPTAGPHAVDPIPHAAPPTAVELELHAPRGHAGSPSATGVDPVPHAATPTAVELQLHAPRGHAGSPSATSVDPVPHAATPTAVELEHHAPRGHAGSPSSAFNAQAHAGSPAAHELDAPHGHPGSPEVHSDPTPHRGSPEVIVNPARHPGSPAAELLGAPQGHPSSPAFLGDPSAHSGSPAMSFEPVEHGDAPTTAATPVAPAVAGGSGLLGGLARAFRAALGVASQSTTVDEWGKDAQLSRSLRPLAELLYERYWRVKTSGIEHVPNGPCVLVANHAGALPLDGPVLHLALRRERPELAESRWLLEDQVFYAPFVGTLANRLGAVRASPENAHRLLSEGRPLIVFPEGIHGLSKPFAERYQLRRFGRGGYLKIALRAGVPVIPVAIVGGEESMPLLAKLPGGPLGIEYLPLTLPPLPARWHLRFGEPIDLSGAPAEPEGDLSWVEAKNLEVRDSIESMLKDLLSTRAGVFQ